MSKHQKYARIGDYNTQLMIPVSLLEKILQAGFMVSTRYENGRQVVDRVKDINEVYIHDQEEIDIAQAQQALAGE